MSTASITGTDVHVRNAVVRQLDWDPDVDAGAVGVSAHDSVVTLTGFVDTYAEKLAAERVAKRVRGVRAVANDITVRQMMGPTDADIAHESAEMASAQVLQQAAVSVLAQANQFPAVALKLIN